MSTPHLGEFFTALLSCAIERCQRGTPATLRLELGRLCYLTFGYSERDWLDQAIFEASLDDQSQVTLLAQLDQTLSANSPAWLDRVQLRALLLGVIRLVRASWNTREQLLSEVCHIFSLSPKHLMTTDLSNVATLAPHLWHMLQTRASERRHPRAQGVRWAPIPREYTPLRVLDYQEGYWRVIARRSGLTVCLELIRFPDHADSPPSSLDQASRALQEEVSGWLPVTRQGAQGPWLWIERPAHLDLSLLTKAHQRMTTEQAVLVCLPVLRALSALHRTDRVCGILTPRQVLIDPECRSLLGGRLFWHPHAEQLLAQRWRIDEMRYWSPERIFESNDPTPQADMWAFGVILYQLLCGELPWGDAEGLIKLSREIKSLDYDVMIRRAPVSLRAFLSRCLTPDLDQRWSHATQALEALSEVAEHVSPLLQGQRLSEQWTVLMEVDGPQRFIEETAIIPAFEPEEYLARFVQVRADLYDLASPHIDALTLSPLFPHLQVLHERWWTNHATLQDVQSKHASSMESFRVSLTEIAPEFLFEQLTLLSQQKETLEKRYQERIRRLERERVTLRAEVRQHALDTLTRLWNELGLPPDLIPNISIEAAAHRGAHRSAGGEAEQRELSDPPLDHVEPESTPISAPPAEFEKPPRSASLAHFAPPPLSEPPMLSAISGVDHESISHPPLHEPSLIPNLTPPEAERATAELREEVFSTPPHERLERLSELGARMRQIERSQPAQDAPPPEWTLLPDEDEPPLVFSDAPYDAYLNLDAQQQDLEMSVALSDLDVQQQEGAFDPDELEAEDSPAFDPFNTNMMEAQILAAIEVQKSLEESSIEPKTDHAFEPYTSTFDPDQISPSESMSQSVKEPSASSDSLSDELVMSPSTSAAPQEVDSPEVEQSEPKIYEPPSIVFNTLETPVVGPPAFTHPPQPEPQEEPPLVMEPPPEEADALYERLINHPSDQLADGLISTADEPEQSPYDDVDQESREPMSSDINRGLDHETVTSSEDESRAESRAESDARRHVESRGVSDDE